MTDELRDLLDKQHGIVTRRQVLAAGISRDRIRHALSVSYTWQKVAPGVYATFSGPLQQRHRVMAALLYAGPFAMVTGSTACRAYRMKYVPSTERVQILVPHGVQRASVPIARIRRTRNLPTARMVRGFPCAPPERAALDASGEAKSLRAVRAVLCEAVQEGLTTIERLTTTANRLRGVSALARTALYDVVAGCRSAPECELRDLIRTSAVLPEPQWNQPLPAPDDDRALIPDACWPEARLVVEVDSSEWHRRGEKAELTERRRAAYAALGFRVLPVSPRRLREEPDVVRAEIETAHRQGLELGEIRRAG